MENNWFEALEVKTRLPVNGEACVGAVHIVNGMPGRDKQAAVAASGG